MALKIRETTVLLPVSKEFFLPLKLEIGSSLLHHLQYVLTNCLLLSFPDLSKLVLPIQSNELPNTTCMTH